MSTVTKSIGLSLGADICWPGSYEAILRKLDLAIPVDGQTVKFHVERVRIEPFDLAAPKKYDMLLDRITHWHMITREWVKKATLDGTYTLNNPWSIQAYEKHTTYVAMMRLGMPIPKTVMIPPKEYNRKEGDVAVTVDRYNNLFSLAGVGESVGYPAFLKPYDGGAWVGVKQVKNAQELHKAYDESGIRVQHLQAGVKNWDLFVRGLGVGPQVNVMKYDPDQPLHGRYVVAFNYLDSAEWEHCQRVTRVINAFFGWDFNSCEMLRADGTFFPIDFANACPDSQVTSLHFHFPWLVKSLLKWSIFCAATSRKPTLHPNWKPYLDIADTDLPFSEKLLKYDDLAKKHFDAAKFEKFCATHLKDFDRVAWEFFGSDEFKGLVRQKVAALYPKHEIDVFTEHFYGLVQFWRKTEAEKNGWSMEA